MYQLDYSVEPLGVIMVMYLPNPESTIKVLKKRLKSSGKMIFKRVILLVPTFQMKECQSPCKYKNGFEIELLKKAEIFILS